MPSHHQSHRATTAHEHHPPAAAGSTSTTRIEYEPYKRRAMSTLPSPTMSTSMYEVFNWGNTASDTTNCNGGRSSDSASLGGTTLPSHWSTTPFRTGKRMQFSIAGPQINIDDEPSSSSRQARPINRSSTTENFYSVGYGSGNHKAKGGPNSSLTFQRGGGIGESSGGGGGGGGIGSGVPANGERKSAVRIAFAQFAGVVLLWPSRGRCCCCYPLDF